MCVPPLLIAATRESAAGADIGAGAGAADLQADQEDQTPGEGDHGKTTLPGKGTSKMHT